MEPDIESDFEGLVERVYEEPHDEDAPPEAAAAPGPELDLAAYAARGDEIPPHDLEAEIAVLGSMLLAPETAIPAVSALLRARDFYRGPHGEVFGVLQAMPGVDVVLLREELLRRGVLEKIGGTSFLSRIVASVPSAANAEHYARIVAELSRRRDLTGAAEIARRAAAAGDDAALAKALQMIAKRQAPPVAPPKMRVITGDQLVSTYYPPIEWLVGSEGEGLIYRGGLTLLTASHKRGKSLTALGLAVAGLVRRHVFPGDNEATFLGTPVTGAGAVLYCSAEGGPRLVKMRVSKIEPHLGEDLKHLVVCAEPPLPRIDTDEGLAQLAEVVRAHGIVLAVIDPLSWFIRIENERDAGLVRDICERLRAWAEALNVGVLLVHHLKHVDADATPTASGGRGSSEWGNAVDVVISLWPDDDGDRRVSRVVFAGRWGDPDPCKVRVNTESLLMEFVCRLSEGKGEKTASGAAVQKVSDLELLTALRTIGGWVRPRPWAEAAGLSYRALMDRLRDLAEHEDVEVREASRGGREYRFRGNDPATMRTAASA